MFSSNSSSIYSNKYGDKIDTSSQDFSAQESSFNLGDPQPHRFTIKSCMNYGNITVARINYPDCQNFSGDKILVYQGDVVDKINKADVLDPHFLETELSPILRISPSKEGQDFLNKIVRQEFH